MRLVGQDSVSATERLALIVERMKGASGTSVAVAVFKDAHIEGEVVASREGRGTRLRAVFTKLPAGKHGFHIHKAGDLRGEGCMGACEHLHLGSHPVRHGSAPSSSNEERHTGDLGNIQCSSGSKSRYSYYLSDAHPSDLWGRSLIVHADEDDLGKGDFPDSATTGHSGKRIGCAIFGRGMCSATSRRTTRKKA